ncbi:MspA family porin [Nocardia terpenica]|uniref:MspA family protein n=1 Tax=Nocardia terpenica TaxID=455432 RepID=A0A291RQ28_9NOCA|nr:hypothetical protein CRH09_28885 [Nocardia terpenica]MBF6063954.1 MspA family porin [Nocardia terpenica]MBF6107810.1 MspA family porin [Nocardia terpenica]MBF6114878.1 MspA family porin [Nocardia terpenica]MBF6121135.1 MspA family porin [Nocardia terpenica]
MRFVGLRVSIVAISGVVTAAVIAGVGAGSAAADAMPDKQRQVVTDDGWTLSITKNHESLDRSGSLNGSPTSHEAFGSVGAVADVTGSGSKPVTGGTITVGYQLGCQVDVSSGVQLGLNVQVGPNAGVTIGPAPGVSVGGSAIVQPSITSTLKPGAITNVTLGTKPLADQHGSITVDQSYIKVDSCLGPVTMRTFATATVSTSANDNTVTVYGDPVTL